MQATGIGGFLNLQKQFVEILPVPTVASSLRKDLEKSLDVSVFNEPPTLAEYWSHPVQDAAAAAFSLSPEDGDRIEAWFRKRSVRGFNEDGTPTGADLEETDIDREEV